MQNLIYIIKDTPYKFLSQTFVKEHAENLLGYHAGNLNELNIKGCNLLNQEFMRARFGGMYDAEKCCRDMYFRISSNGFDWSENIKMCVSLLQDEVETVTVVRDRESTGEFFYYKTNGVELDKAPKEQVLNEIIYT